jgi:hypothetical protein
MGSAAAPSRINDACRTNLLGSRREAGPFSWMHLEQDERSEKDWVSKKDWVSG